MELLRRKPQRITTTVSWGLHQKLQQQALQQGRSVSNLVSHYLELAASGLLP
jgi:predicted HicB family RNase H-like nuclease